MEEQILTQINKFRKDHKEFFDKKVKPKKFKNDYQNFLLKSPKNLNALQKSQELFNLAKEEAKKYSEESEYNEIQIIEELKQKLSNNFSKNDFGLIALFIDENDGLENIIPNIIVNELDKEKKGRNMLINPVFTHIGIGIFEENDEKYLILIFSKIVSIPNKRKDEKAKKDTDTKKISPEIKNSNKEINELKNKEKKPNDDLIRRSNNKNRDMCFELETAKDKNKGSSKNKAIINDEIHKENKIIKSNEVFFIVSIKNTEKTKDISLIKIPENKEVEILKKESKIIGDLKIFYFKIDIPQNSKFKLIQDNISKEVDVKNDNILEPVELYESKKLSKNIIFLIEQYRELLRLFNEDEKTLIKVLDNIAKKIKYISLKVLIYLLDLFYEFNYQPLFLNNFEKIEQITFNKVEKSSLSKTIHNTIALISSKNIINDNDTIKKKNFILKIYGNYYLKFPPNKDEELKNDELFIKGIFMLIEDKDTNINELYSKNLIPIKIIIIHLIQNSKDKNDFGNIFAFLKNLSLTLSLELLVENYELINKRYNELNESTFLWSGELKMKLPEISKKDDIEQIFDYIRKYLKQDKGKNFIKIDLNDLIGKMLEYYKKNNLENLIKLKNNLKSLKINEFDFYSINESIHTLILIKLNGNENISNNEIIRLVKEDELYDKNPEIFKNFDIHDKNKYGFSDFIRLKNKNCFYKIFIEKIKDLNDLTILFELFNENITEKFAKMILEKLERIPDYKIDEKYSQIILENLYIIYSKLNMYNNNKYFDFSNYIENISLFKHDKWIQKIYLFILKKEGDKINENSKRKFAKYFINNIKDIDYKEFFHILKHSENKKFGKELLDSDIIINKFLYKENDIYSQEKSPSNFELYKLFVEDEFINDDYYLNAKYFQHTSELNGKIFSNMKDLKIPYLKLSKSIEINNEIFLSNMKIIFINENNKPDELFNNICENLNNCSNKIRQLEKIYEYLKTFEPKNGEILFKQIGKIIKNLKRKSIKEILEENETKKIENYDLLFEKSKNLRFKFSIIFMKIYDQLKNENIDYDEIKLFQDSVGLYNTIVNKIINYKNENFLNIKYINIILPMIKNRRDKVKKEMEFISEEFKEELNEKKESINDVENNLTVFSYLEEIKAYIKAILWLINFFKNLMNDPDCQETDFTKSLSRYSENLSKDNIKCEDVKNSSELLVKYEIDVFDENKNDDFNSLILKLYGREDQINFCVGKKDGEIKNLNEYLQDNQNESGSLQPIDFDDFIGCKKYVNDIKETQIKSDIELFKLLKNKFYENDNLIIKFNNYLEKYGEIKELYEYSLSDSNEITKKIIQKIMMNSIISITKKLDCFNFILQYESSTIELKDIEELKCKSLLIQNMFKEDNNYYNQIAKFKKIVFDWINLCKYIKKFISSGYPSDIEINLTLKNGELNQKNILKEYKSKYNEFKSLCNDIYINKPNLRFLYGPLFLCAKKEKELIFILKYISNGLIKKVPEKPILPDEQQLFFESLDNYITKCFELNGINLEKIFEKNKIINDQRGIYKLPIYNNSEVGNLLLSLYKHYTRNYPLSNTVLICNEYTSVKQIRAFLYLSFKCEFQIMFSLICMEKADSNKIFKELCTFNQKYRKEMISCLTIIYYDNSEMKDFLSQMKPDIKIIELDNENLKGIKFENNNIEIWTSEKVGYGKSEAIKEKIKMEGKKYIYFPIGGEFSIKRIIQRLINLNIPKADIENYVLHLDIAETNLVDLLKEILLKILILKKLDFNEKIFYFDNLRIKIELPNGFYNYMNKFPIFSLFKNEHIKNIVQLTIPKDKHLIKDSPILIVANFLQKYKDGQIGKENINLEAQNKLTQEESNLIIDEYINKNDNFNNYQKINWINSFAVQIKKFSINPIIDPSLNDNNNNIISNFRNQYIKCILETLAPINKGPFYNLIKSQTISQENGSNYDEEKENELAKESYEKIQDNITYDNFTGSLCIPNDDDSTFTIIKKQEKGTEEYLNLVELFRKLSKDESFELHNFLNRDNGFYLDRLKDILFLGEMPLSEEEINILNQQLKEKGIELSSDIYSPVVNEDRKLYMKKLAKLNGNYIYTIDNFIKTVLIYERIQASIPVILMGETGCGKTSLLKMLSIFMYKGLSEMKTLNIHADINEEDIIKFMKEQVFPELHNTEKKLNKIMEKFDKNNINNIYDRNKFQEEQRKKLEKRKIWVFFDEMNTCNSMNLLAEMMLKRTMLGEPLHENIVFLGAINPYIKKTKNMKQYGLVYNNDKSFKSNSLVYTVNPLPHTLMNFVFNFNSLNQKEEREYIKSMIQQNFIKHYSNKEDEDYKNLIELTPNIICECHKFMRDKFGVASVSLREIRRFNIFFDFFSDYLKNKSINKENYQQTYHLLLATIKMTIYLCYYLRIAEKDLRKEFNDKISQYFSDKNFLIIPKKEESYISEQFIFDVDRGIALNNSLKESLFTSFVCVVNKIPLIIVGKPGGGKSLTVQALNSTMKGIYSESPLIKQYPQLFIYKYQGSVTSTSKGIIKTFEKAKKVKKETQKCKNGNRLKEKYIALIFFDELGLAEISPNNPLKSLHSLLEYDDNDIKIGLIGISNWNIDASKMNRCVVLSISDLGKDDLLNTSEIISKAIDYPLANKYKSIIDDLALSYYYYMESVNNDKTKKNFHGKRDFYNLIICFMRELVKNKEILDGENKNEDKILINSAMKSFSRNFGGFSDSIDNIIAEFKKIHKNCDDNYYKYNVLECIEDNINDYNSRFLMLVANSNIMKYLENVLSSHNKKIIFLTGNKMKLKNEGYIEDLLNKIQFFMNQDIVLILQNLEEIYPSLYELFNQNYIIIGDKSFTKIAFSSSKSSSEVHKKFRIILLVSQKLDEVAPPLLNRFEKQLISFNDVINENQKNIAKEISSFLYLIKTLNKKKEALVYNIPELLINCSEDEIEGMIYKICNENKDKSDDKEFIINELFNIIVPTFPQDIIAAIKYLLSSFEEKNYYLSEKIIRIYKEKNIYNFQEFLSNIKKNKNIIYTFSHYYDYIFPEKSNIKYKSIDIDSNLSENKLEDIISESVDNNYEFLLIKFNEKNLDKIENIIYIIDNYEAKYGKLNKESQIINKNPKINENKLKIIIIIYISRKYTRNNTNNNIEEKKIQNAEFISNLDDSYNKIFIDNLQSERNDFLNILDMKDPKEILNSIINFDKFLDYNFYKIMIYFDYKLIDKFSNITINQYTNKIMKKFIDKEDEAVIFIRNLIKENIIKNIKNIDYISNVFTSDSFNKTDIDFFQILETYISSQLRVNLLSIVYQAEKNGILSSFLFKDNNYKITNNKFIKNYIKEFIDVNGQKKENFLPKIRANKIDIIPTLSIPGIYNLISEIIKNKKIFKDYIKNENILRPIKKLLEEDTKVDEYNNKYKKLVKKTIGIFSANKYKKLLEENDENIIFPLIEDYLIIYSIKITNKFSKYTDISDNPINIIDLLLQLKFYILSDDDNYEKDNLCKVSFLETQKDLDISKFSEIFLFLESYTLDITYFAQIYCLLSTKIPNLLNKIKEIIDSKKIITEISERNQKYKKRVNEAFFFLMEALIRAIFQSINEIFNLEEYYSFFKSLILVESTLNKINQKFMLYSNELYYLRNLLSIYNIFKNDKEVKDIIKEIMSSTLELENIDNNNDKEEYQEKNLEYSYKIKEIISKKYGEDSDELSDYMSNFLRSQYRRAKDEDIDYKLKIIEIAFGNEKFIQNSLFFIEQTITADYKNNNFLYLLNSFNDNKILSFYEKIKSETFNHVLLYYFELKANNYFNEIKKKYKLKSNLNNNKELTNEECTELILGKNLENLKEALIHLDNIVENKNLNENDLNNLAKIYSIAYIKLYMKQLAEIFKNNNDKIQFDVIFNLLTNVDNNSRKVIIIYFLKNIFITFENYSQFEYYIMKKLNDIYFNIYNDINKYEKKEDDINNNYILNHQFIPDKIYEEKYSKSLLQFNKSKQYNFQSLEFLINKDMNLDVLLCLLVNNLLSYAYSSDKENAKKLIKLFKIEFSKISKDLNAPKISIDLLLKFLDINELLKNNNNESLSQPQFEQIAYSFRYVLQSSFQNKNNFYYNLLIFVCKEYISNNFIIGALPLCNNHINSYYSLKEIMNQFSEKLGFYLCTCGLYYMIDHCTRPNESIKCINKNCKRPIGVSGKDIEAKKKQTNQYRICRNDFDKNIALEIEIPYITLDEYKAIFVDNRPMTKGLKKEEQEFLYFKERHQRIRKMDELAFRLLNYILYSHLLFSNLLGNLSDNDLDSYIPSPCNCLEMIEKNWKIMKTILNEKGIAEIEVFMNIIFFKVSDLLNKAEDLSTNEKREEIELNIKNSIDELINNRKLYLSKEKEYSEMNQIFKKSDSNTLVEIILENYSPFDNLYSEKDFPNLGMFLLSEYPNLKDLSESIEKVENYSQKYFLLNQILINDEEYDNISNVININEFVNPLLRKYNNKIDRNEAKNLKISSCLNNLDLGKEKGDIKKKFIESWKKIKSKCRQYLCKPKMPELDITEENFEQLTLNYFLPDDGELGGGMYLASAYRYFIEIQNEFINNMMNILDINSPIKAYSFQLSQEIKVQETTEDDLLNLRKIHEKINKLITRYSMRDIFKDGKINFKGFKMPVIYNFNAIEKELVRNLLPGVKKFVDEKSEEPIKFMTYKYEAFRGNRSSIITNYNLKYSPRELSQEEENLLIEFIENENNIIDVLSTCQILIDFIQGENYDKNKTIYSVIINLPKYIELNENFVNFIEDIGEKEINLKNNQKIFSIDTLINIYDIIEYICWNQFKNNLNEQYKKPLNVEIKKKLENNIDNIMNNNGLIKKQDLADAVRRLISRYLTGKREDTDIGEDQKLLDYIVRADLWKPYISENQNFENELTNIFNQIQSEIKIICDQNKIQCDICAIKKNLEKIVNPCNECMKCKGDLLIGHSLEFFELINEGNIRDILKAKKNDNKNENKNEIIEINNDNVNDNDSYSEEEDNNSSQEEYLNEI